MNLLSQQWDPNGLSPGRDVSVRGDEMLVFTEN